jgi:hypothetical protein
MLIGQNGAARSRFAYVPNAPLDERISTDTFTPKDWVVATGGGHFFAPALSAIRTALAS